MDIVRQDAAAGQVSSDDDGLRFLAAIFGPFDTILIRPVETWNEQDTKTGKVKKRSQVDFKGTTYDTLARMPARLTWHRKRSEQTKCNVFFAVCPRHDRDGQYDEAWQIRKVLVLWADIDDAKPEEAVERCKAAGLPPPSIVVSSGRGTHLYWLLTEPILIDDGDPRPILVDWDESQNGDGKKTKRKYIVEPNGERKYLDKPDDRPPLSPTAQRVQNIVAGIAKRIGGDSTHDISRLLRVPATENRKDERNGRAPQPCTLVLLDTSRRYSFETFAPFAIEQDTNKPNDKADTETVSTSSTLSADERAVLDGLLYDCEHASDRSKADFALCREAVKRGWGKAAIWAACSHVGKVAEEGRRYFDRTWSNAEASTKASSTPAKPPKRIRFVDVGTYTPPPVDVLPKPVCGYIKAAAEALGSDVAYILLPLIIALAAAAGLTRRICLRRTWREPLIIWGGIVGESGTLKSPAVDLATSTLQRKQAEAFARHAEEVALYERDLALFEADFIEWKKTGRKKKEPPPEKPKPPRCQRYIVDDVTVEALAERHQEAPRGLLAVRDELAGWALSFNQYKARGGADVAAWLKIHGGRSLLVDRKSGVNKVIYLERAGVWIVGGIQPDILRRVLTTELFENGCAARLLLASPPAMPKVWTEATIDERTEEALDFVFDKLLALDFDVDDDGKTKPVDLDLTAEGKRAWVAFYNSHATEQAALTGDLAAAWSKLEGYAARFALLVHLLRWAADDTTLESKSRVDAASVEAGAALARWFGAEAKRIYGVLGDDPDTAELRRTVELIRRRGGAITIRELQQSDRRFRAAEDAEAELNKLAAAGQGAWEVLAPAGGRGPTKREFRLSTASTGNTFAAIPEENRKPVDVDTPGSTFDADAVNSILAEAAVDDSPYGDDSEGVGEWVA